MEKYRKLKLISTCSTQVLLDEVSNQQARNWQVSFPYRWKYLNVPWRNVTHHLQIRKSTSLNQYVRTYIWVSVFIPWTLLYCSNTLFSILLYFSFTHWQNFRFSTLFFVYLKIWIFHASTYWSVFLTLGNYVAKVCSLFSFCQSSLFYIREKCM